VIAIGEILSDSVPAGVPRATRLLGKVGSFDLVARNATLEEAVRTLRAEHDALRTETVGLGTKIENLGSWMRGQQERERDLAERLRLGPKYSSKSPSSAGPKVRHRRRAWRRVATTMDVAG